MVQCSVISSHGKHLFDLMSYLRPANSFYDAGFCIEVICNIICHIYCLNPHLTEFWAGFLPKCAHIAKTQSSVARFIGLVRFVFENTGGAGFFAKSCTGLVSNCQQSAKLLLNGLGGVFEFVIFFFGQINPHRIGPKACKIYISNTKLTVKWVYT